MKGSHTGSWVANAAVVVASLSLFVLAELALRALGVEPEPWPALGKAFREAHRFEGTVVDPLLGPLPRPGWRGRWFDRFEAEIDSQGFRATGLAPPEVPEQTVAFLGDSCSFGWDVDTRETYVARLDTLQREAGPPRFALVNGAYPGNTSVVGLYKLRERILPLQPDRVVLAFSANNAFRFATSSDVERFRAYALRRFALRSRLVQIVASWIANARAGRTAHHSRDRSIVNVTPLAEIHRVADPPEFEAALRRSIAEARASGARVALLLLPRASQVSDEYGYEDTAGSQRNFPLPPRTPGAAPSDRERVLVEYSCLDPRRPDVVDRLHEGLERWQAVRPRDPELRHELARGARAFVDGDLAAARRSFESALASEPKSPLAHYALGVTLVESGEPSPGLSHLARADELACNVFLQYQVTVRRIAFDLDVPVIDAVLLFQAHEGEALFVDSAHPSPRGHELIAEQLWRFFSKGA